MNHPLEARLRKLEQAQLQTQSLSGTEPFDSWRIRKIAEILSACFPKQLAFIQDPHRAKCALCTRRAGKSYGVSCMHLLNLLSGGNGIYIAPTAKQARRIMWNGRAGLKAVARRFKMTQVDMSYGVDFNNTEMIATLLGNKANCMLGGAETRDDCEKYRGEPAKLATIDEPASIKEHLEYLVDEVLEPTLLDDDGTLALVGSPGRVLAGKFYQVSTGIQPETDPDEDEDAAFADWSVHKWSMQDNPHLKNRDVFLARIFRRHGWDPDNPPPRAQREYFGLWVREGDTLVYRFASGRNIYRDFPRREDWEYGLAVDLGNVDASAFRIIAYSPNHAVAYALVGLKEIGLDITAVAERIMGTRKMPFYNSEYAGPIIQGYAERYDLRWIVIDMGALGKMIVEEMNARHRLSPQAEPAEKKDKQDFIDLFNDDLLRGRFQVKADDPVIGEWETLQWKEDATKRQEDPRQPNDLSDATLYGWRRAKHYWATAKDPEPLPGSPEANAAYEAAMEAQIRASIHRGQNNPENW